MAAREIVFSYLDASREGIVELESLLTSIPALAPESAGTGELAKAEALQAWLAERGIHDMVRLDASDERVPSGIRPNIVATIPGASDEGRLWIMTHLDVVPEGDRSMWSSDPYVVVERDGRVYGRGVEDNQQGLTASVFCALAFVKNGIVPERTIKLLFVADEECGSRFGIQYLLREHDLFRKDDIIVIPDGGLPDGSMIEVAEKNICWLKVVTKGRQTHGSTPDSGANAFLAACELALAIHELENAVFTARDPLFDPDRTTLSPTKKEANVPNVNTIPGDDVFYVDMRILPCYPVADVLGQVEILMRRIEKKHGVKMHMDTVQSNQSKSTAPDAPVVRILAKAVKAVYGVDAVPRGIGGGTVGAYLRSAGYDCVVWAKMDETAHQPDESASIANIIGDAKVFAELALSV
jgi:succinyl-diaminopimelate desuccinylase